MSLDSASDNLYFWYSPLLFPDLYRSQTLFPLKLVSLKTDVYLPYIHLVRTFYVFYVTSSLIMSNAFLNIAQACFS